MTAQPFTIAILLASYQGARFIGTQLDSLAAQEFPHWRLVVSDDGSTDATPDLVRAFAARHADREVTLIPGPRQGATSNFLHLLAHLRDGEAMAFCDQDDLWLPHRLATGVATLTADGLPHHADAGADVAIHDPSGRRASGRPSLHVTRTTICDDALSALRPAPLYTRPPGFLNALVQACTPGNTMLVDPAGAALLRAAAPAALRAGVVSHDWWSYLMISGAGGTVIRDPHQTVLYRQHHGNVMGRNDTPRAMLARLTRLGGGDFGGWLAANIAALKTVAPMLTRENRARLTEFSVALARPGPAAAVALARLGVYRQTRIGTAALLAAAAAGRLRH